MSNKPITCEICSDKIDISAESHIDIMGGDNRNLSWLEYLSEVQEKYKPHFIAAKKTVEKSEFYKATAEIFSNKYYLKFSDGVTMGFSWRAWGDFMQAIVDKREGYMKYYM